MKPADAAVGPMETAWSARRRMPWRDARIDGADCFLTQVRGCSVVILEPKWPRDASFHTPACALA